MVAEVDECGGIVADPAPDGKTGAQKADSMSDPLWVVLFLRPARLLFVCILRVCALAAAKKRQSALRLG
jgi:hypothetical protein